MSSKKSNTTKNSFMDIINVSANGARWDSNKPAGVSFLIVQMVARGALAAPWSVHISITFSEWKG